MMLCNYKIWVIFLVIPVIPGISLLVPSGSGANEPEVAPGATEATKEIFELMEEEDIDVFELGEFLPTRQQSLGPTTSVFEITAQDILDQNSRSVAEALRFVPSTFLSVGGTKNPSLISIRGLNAGANVIYVDGRPVYDPFFGDVDFRNLPVDNIAKIKVIKGPVDPAYGPNALGSVINIITKRGTKKSFTRVNISYEEHSTQDYWGEHGGRKGNLNYYVAGSYRRSNGFELSDDFESTQVQPGNFRRESSFDKYNISTNIGYDFSAEERVALLFGYYNADLDNPVDINVSPTARRGIPFTRFKNWKRWYVDLHGQTRLWDRVEVRGNFYYDQFKNDLEIFTDNTFTTKEDISKDTNDVVGANLRATVDIADSLKMKGGAVFKNDTHDRKESISGFHEDLDSFTTGYFVDFDYTPIEQLQIFAGVNYDILFNGGDTVDSTSPRGAVVYKPFRTTRLHVAIGRKSRLPRLINLFSGIGNSDLDAERNFSVEIGGNQLFYKDLIEVGITGFRNDVNDGIDFVRLPGGGTQDQNNTDAVSTGFTTFASAIIREDLSTSLDYTYTDVSVDPKNDSKFDRFYHQLNARLNYTPSFGLSVFLQASYIDGEPDSDPFDSTIGNDSHINFFLLNGKLSYEIWKGIKPFVSVENITDSNYERHIDFPQPGRRVFFGVNAAF
jgi:outer membrane receptor for ferrienterochelin and colicin